MYTVELVNRHSLGESKDVEIINEPTLTEEINASYTFEFDAHYTAKSYFSSDVLIKVEGQYFQIARVVKNRQNSLSLSVQCEHISYELIDAEDETEEYEDTAQGMLATILSGTRFTLGTCMGTSLQYYKPSSLEVRQRLIDVANLFSGELVFDNFTISLVPQRGSNKGLKVELGVNLLGVTEEIDYVEGTTAYELDLVDLAEVSGHELDFSSAEIGDTIQIIDPELGIHASERILSFQRNPFKPQLPVVTVGDYIRDLTEYFREEEEEEEEDGDPRANYYLEKFQIGDTDCLNLNGVEVDNDEALPEGITAKVDFMLFEKLKGVSLQLKPKYKDYHITVYKVYEDRGFETLDYAANQSAINSWLLPTERITGIGVLVTSTPFNTFDVDKDDFRQYGVNFNRVTIDVLREFKIGKVNALGLSGIEIFPETVPPDEIEAEITYEELGEYKGLYLSLKKAYRDWYIKLTSYDAEGVPTDYNFADIKDEAAAWILPSDGVSAISVTSMEKPPAAFVESEHLQQTYAVKFTGVTLEDQPWLDEFKIGDGDCLQLPGLDVTDQLDILDPEIEPKGAVLELSEKVNSIIIKVNTEYKDYFKQVLIRESDDVITSYTPPIHVYDNSDFDNTGKLTITTPFPNAKKGKITILISEEMPGGNELSGNFKTYMVDVAKESAGEIEDYLAEFRIGTEDMLPIASDETKQAKAYLKGEKSAVLPSARFDAEEFEYTGVFAGLQQKFEDYHLTIIAAGEQMGQFLIEAGPWSLVGPQLAEMPILPPETTYMAFTFVVTDIPFEEVSASNLDSVFIKAFGVTVGDEPPEPPKPIVWKDIMYAYLWDEQYNNSSYVRETLAYNLHFITNITNFRENFMDEDYMFETTLSNEFYPCSYGARWDIDNWFETPSTVAVLVQVVDGVITNVIDRLYSIS